MKIVHLAPFLQDDAGRVIADLADGQRARGHHVTVVASRTNTPECRNDQSLLDRLDGCGVATYLADSLAIRDYGANLAAARLLGDVVAQQDGPDVIHAHGTVPALIALMFAGRRRKPVGLLQTVHEWNAPKSAGQATADVYVLNMMDRVAAASSHTSAILRGLGASGAHLRLVPVGVGEADAQLDHRDRTVLDEMRRARKRGAFVIACPGNIGPRRNHDLVIEALARLQQLRSTRQFHIVFTGTGNADQLSVLAQSANQLSRITFCGSTRAPRAIAAEADAVLPISRHDQTIDVLEAFCDRALAIVSDTQEMSELVTDSVTGLRFADGNVDALARVMHAAAERPLAERQAIIDRARRRYEQGHTLAAMLDAYELEYEVIAPEVQRSGRTSRRYLRAVNG